MTKPDRPFDPQLYFEFRLYREFSSGIPDQWMSHGIDLVHFFMNETPPRSIVSHGGVFAWHDERQNPDTFQALVEYPTFLVSYSTSFGNDCDSFSRIMGKKATLINIGGEGSPRWKVVDEKGNHEDNPTIERAERWVTLPGDNKPGPINIGDEDLSHMSNWFDVHAERQQEDERDRRQRIPARRCRHHGGAVVLAGQTAVLRFSGRADPGQRTSPLTHVAEDGSSGAT